MEKQNFGFIKKSLIILCILGICAIAYFMVIFPYLNRGEGDPYFKFYEVPVNVTTNSTIVHLEDKDIMDIRGLDVKQEKGKITRIYIRNSEDPETTPYEFNQKYGSSMSDPSSRKYLEYNGVYDYAVEIIP